MYCMCAVIDVSRTRTYKQLQNHMACLAGYDITRNVFKIILMNE